MKNLRKTLLLLTMAAALLATGGAHAWGFLGHKVINQVAVYSLPGGMQAFYYRHLAELVRLSTAPDERRSSTPGEAPRHFIDMDHYSEDNPFGKVPRSYDKAVDKFTADTLNKYGTVPWTVLEMKDSLTEAFRRRDTLAIVRYSAELGHYLGDAFVPLHTTVNYDGQLTNQNGLHSLWESQLVERSLSTYHLDSAPAQYLKDPQAAIWTAVQGSYGFLGETLDRALALEKQFPPSTRYTFSHRYGKTQRRFSDAYADAYAKEVGGQVAFRLKGAPALLASFWLTAWQDAGKPDLGQLMTPAKLSEAERETLKNELAARKNHTLSADQTLLLALQKTKRAEVADDIKPAADMPPPPAPEPAAPTPPTAADPAAPAEAAPSKIKIKRKDAAGRDKQKSKNQLVPTP
ncbi:zinc dependent phospholipase C family protein [uncultured Hymenobacter sp.]|uniref:zinc dependent phospholipase C family protein n=1 Tax=uncultured Hymenobacter sp. TaxID=170016 RepID=UPI0035CA1ECE